MCIAGVFGGLDSGVTEETTSIFFESAYFNPTTIRKTARRHGLNTDASFRFERGIDPNNTIYVLKLAALMAQEIAGGESVVKSLTYTPTKSNHSPLLFLTNTSTTSSAKKFLPKPLIIYFVLSRLKSKIAVMERLTLKCQHIALMFNVLAT